MKQRKYIALLDNGHDHADIEYFSEHRAGSKGNLEDCKRELQKKKGSSARQWRIVSTTRYEYY